MGAPRRRIPTGRPSSASDSSAQFSRFGIVFSRARAAYLRPKLSGRKTLIFLLALLGAIVVCVAGILLLRLPYGL